MEKESQTKWATKSGYLPLRKSVIDSKEFKDYVEKKIQQKEKQLKNLIMVTVILKF